MIMLVEDDPSKNDSDAPATKSSIAELATLHCHQQHARNERLLNQRKVKSRNAARMRRGKENYEFYELAKLLPVPVETSSQLDKASIIRLTMSFLKMREFSFCNEPTWKLPNDGPPPNRTVTDASRSVSLALHHVAVSKVIEEQLGSRILQSLDGFMFALNCHGRFLYVSETVSIFLGLSQVEMIGASIFDYTYPDDRNELAVHLGLTLSSRSDTEKTKSNKKKSKFEDPARSFFIRMKSTLTKRGVTPKSSCYKVVHICARAQKNTFKHSTAKNLAGSREENAHSKDPKTLNPPLGIVAFGSPLPPLALIDVTLHDNFFVTRVNPSLQFTYCETVAENLIGYNAREVVGQSLYHCVHAADVEKIKKCHVELLTKGHVRTPYFRWLHKSGGYRWVCSVVMLLPNQRLYPEQSFIWIHTVISEITAGEKILDMHQLPVEEVERRLDIFNHCPSGGKKKQKKAPSHEEADSQKPLNGSEDDDDPAPKKSAKQPVIRHTGNATGESSTALPRDSEVESADECVNASSTSASPSGGYSDVGIKTTAAEKSPIAKNKRPSGDREGLKSDDVRRTSEVSGSGSDSEVPEKRPRSGSDVSRETGDREERGGSEPETGAAVESELKIYCVASDFAKHLKHKPTAGYPDTVSEYMDVDSTMWSNPPNKEISNHSDLPPGIKQMHGLMSVRRTTPSAVHHHYPFGINPALLHSNPLLAKIMAAGWGHQLPSADTFMVTTPVQMMQPYHMPGLPDRAKGTREAEENKPSVHTPASVAAVLEELKKDPLHKVNPPNKVVLPSLQEGLIESSVISGCKDLLHSVPQSGSSHRPESEDEETPRKRNPQEEAPSADEGAAKPFPRTLLNFYPGEVLNSHVRGQTVLHVPNTILVPANGVIFNSADPPIIALNSNAGLKLPIVNQCVVQPFAFPQVAKVRSVPF